MKNYIARNNRNASYKSIPQFITSLVCAFTVVALVGCGGPIDATIGGTVNGLSGGTTVGLLDNGGDALTVSSDGNFTFATRVEAPNAYNVTVATQPVGETCTVANGSGNVSQNAGDVTSVAVSCFSTPTGNEIVFGTVVGLPAGASVTLLDNLTDSVTVTGNVPFVFPNALSAGATYSVTVGTNPTGVTCTITNAAGTIPSSGSITAIVVSC